MNEWLKQEEEYAQIAVDLARLDRERTLHSREQAILTNTIGYRDGIRAVINHLATEGTR
jgi:hypothetical protein